MNAYIAYLHVYVHLHIRSAMFCKRMHNFSLFLFCSFLVVRFDRGSYHANY